MVERRHVVGVAVALVLSGLVPAADAGRAPACRKLCRDVIAVECGERLGLPRPDRACRRDMLKQCKRDGGAVCTYPILVGSWRYDLVACTQTCERTGTKSCQVGRYLTFIFLQKGPRLQETSRSLAGWFVDHASFSLSSTSLVGSTATLTGTFTSSSSITNVRYDVDTTHPEDGACHLSLIGELVR